jgi:hypothetical protein
MLAVTHNSLNYEGLTFKWCLRSKLNELKQMSHAPASKANVPTFLHIMHVAVIIGDPSTQGVVERVKN